MTKKLSIAIIGPTASGKSDIAITLAKKFDGEVISADSRQIYRGMNIGSGKEPGKLFHVPENIPVTQNPYMIDTIPHYMIDIIHPRTPYSLGKFLPKTKKIRTDIWKRKKLPIICGGTMFWAQALIEDQKMPHVIPNAHLRKDLAQYSTKQLFTMLQKKDSRRAESIDPKNRQRLIRALEIVAEIGSVPHIQHITTHDPHTLIIAISHPRDVLYDRIAERLEKRLASGMIEETYDLHTKERVSWKRLESFGLEYKWCALFLQKKIPKEKLYDSLLQDIRHYAKRQETWLRRWEKQGALIHHITTVEETSALVHTFLHDQNL